MRLTNSYSSDAVTIAYGNGDSDEQSSSGAGSGVARHTSFKCGVEIISICHTS